MPLVVPPAAKVGLAGALLARRPGLAIAHLLRGANLARLDRDADARAAFRAGLGCDADADVRTRLLVELGVRAEDRGERERLLREAVGLGGNLVAAATAAVALRAVT